MGGRGGRVRGTVLTNYKRNPLVLGHAVVRAVDHLDDLLELRPAAVVLVDAQVEHEAPAAQQLQALDELVRQHRPARLVLQQVPEPPDFRPALAGFLLDQVEIPLHDGGPARQRRPGDVRGAQRRVLGGVALPRLGLARGDALQPRDLHQRVLPPAAVPLPGRQVVLPVRLQEDEAPGRGARAGGLVLVQRVLLAQRVVRRAPRQRVHLGLGVEVDVGVDDGDIGSHIG